MNYEEKYIIDTTILEDTASAIRNKLSKYPKLKLNIPEIISNNDILNIINNSPYIDENILESKYVLNLNINGENKYFPFITRLQKVFAN